MNLSWKNIEQEWRGHLLSHAYGNVLEVGVGTGNNFKHYPANVKVTGTDASARIIERAKEEALMNNVEADFIVSTIENLQLPEHSFDTVVSTFSLSAFDDPGRVMSQFNSWCKPDGMILLLDYGLSRYGFVNWLQRKWEPYYYRRTGSHINRDMLSIISDSMFRVKRVEVKYAGIVYLVWATLIPNIINNDSIL